MDGIDASIILVALCVLVAIISLANYFHRPIPAIVQWSAVCALIGFELGLPYFVR